MSNNLATLLGPDLAAAAPFYGGAPMPANVAKIKAAMLIHHGGLDKALVDAYPAYEAALKANNIPHEGHIYPNSVHGFFNDATPERYNKATAQEAWAAPSSGSTNTRAQQQGPESKHIRPSHVLGRPISFSAKGVDRVFRSFLLAGRGVDVGGNANRLHVVHGL